MNTLLGIHSRRFWPTLNHHIQDTQSFHHHPLTPFSLFHVFQDPYPFLGIHSTSLLATLHHHFVTIFIPHFHYFTYLKTHIPFLVLIHHGSWKHYTTISSPFSFPICTISPSSEPISHFHYLTHLKTNSHISFLAFTQHGYWKHYTYFITILILHFHYLTHLKTHILFFHSTSRVAKTAHQHHPPTTSQRQRNPHFTFTILTAVLSSPPNTAITIPSPSLRRTGWATVICQRSVRK